MRMHAWRLRPGRRPGQAEDEERRRWKAALVELIREADGPIVAATRDAADPEKALAAAAGGRRARILSKRARAWRLVRAWCLDLYGCPYPGTVLHMLVYAQARADEPCGLSTLQSVDALFSFMELCCGVAAGMRFVDSPAYAS